MNVDDRIWVVPEANEVTMPGRVQEDKMQQVSGGCDSKTVRISMSVPLTNFKDLTAQSCFLWQCSGPIY